MSTEVSFDTKVGPSNTSDGKGGSIRQARDGGLVISQSHGQYYEQSSRGTLFCVSGALTGTTIAAGHVAPPAAAAATLLSILNPLGSNNNLEIIEGTISHVSGTPGAGAFAWCMAYQGTAVTASEAVAIKRRLDGAEGGTVAKAWSATTLTGSSVHVITKPFPTSKFAGAIDAASSNLSETDLVNGKIVVRPGFMLTLAPPATGTTHIVVASITYAEVDIQG
jgi:hypothetical protein